MKLRAIVLLIGLGVGGALVSAMPNLSSSTPASIAAESHALHDQMGSNCSPDQALPLAALPPATPAWCNDLTSGPSTFVDGANSWTDEFEHDLNMAGIGDGYREFTFGSIAKSVNFRHNNHWMQDIVGSGPNGSSPPWNQGGASIRPDRSFRFVDGKLVVEADVAAGVTDYSAIAWPEITISTAPEPTGSVADFLYHYGQFGGQWSLGVRLQPDGVPIEAMYAPDNKRRAEFAFWLPEGSTVTGGGRFTPDQKSAWRLCESTDPDLNCRDRFRWEIEKKQLTLFVNGTKYMQVSNMPGTVDVPDALLNSPVYVYFAGVIYKPGAETVRFHWDRLAINPESGPTSAISPPAASGHGH